MRPDHAHRLEHRRGQRLAGTVSDVDCLPAAVVEARHVPAGMFAACVVGLAVKAIRTSYRRWAGPPGRVAAHGEGGSVVKLDARLHEHVGVLADHDAEDVVAPLQEGGHVLAAVERSLAGVDPRRVENGVPDTLSVRRQLSDTAGQDEVVPAAESRPSGPRS